MNTVVPFAGHKTVVLSTHTATVQVALTTIHAYSEFVESRLSLYGSLKDGLHFSGCCSSRALVEVRVQGREDVTVPEQFPTQTKRQK